MLRYEFLRERIGKSADILLLDADAPSEPSKSALCQSGLMACQ